jgi:hypothetical protein
MTDFTGRRKVVVLKTKPDTVLDDVEELMILAEVEKALPKDN